MFIKINILCNTLNCQTVNICVTMATLLTPGCHAISSYIDEDVTLNRSLFVFLGMIKYTRGVLSMLWIVLSYRPRYLCGCEVSGGEDACGVHGPRRATAGVIASIKSCSVELGVDEFIDRKFVIDKLKRFSLMSFTCVANVGVLKISTSTFLMLTCFILNS